MTKKTVNAQHSGHGKIVIELGMKSANRAKQILRTRKNTRKDKTV